MKEEPNEMQKLIQGMAHYMDRWPTEDEVYNFIMGDEEQRMAILNNAG